MGGGIVNGEVYTPTECQKKRSELAKLNPDGVNVLPRGVSRPMVLDQRSFKNNPDMVVDKVQYILFNPVEGGGLISAMHGSEGHTVEKGDIYMLGQSVGAKRSSPVGVDSIWYRFTPDGWTDFLQADDPSFWGSLLRHRDAWELAQLYPRHKISPHQKVAL